ncbi:MAG: hypothetical protein OXF88_18040 [Rhodobacteraceae bacterium]|nr:hypothetical protein [Paracoccaceae bacterium]MCY4136762.1 hypothetical protein [Paracoccaceae bacterium]
MARFSHRGNGGGDRSQDKKEKKTQNCTPRTPHTVVIEPYGVQAGETEQYVEIEPSGDFLGLVMEETLFFKDRVQVGENASVPVCFDKIDAHRTNAEIVATLH